MAASTLSTVAFIYKRLYSDKAVGDLAMRDHPLFNRIKKEGGFTGSAFFYPIRYGNPQGISAVFATAQAAASSSKGLQLQASRKAKYGVITLDGEAMAAAKGDKGAFMSLVTNETDGVLEEMGDRLAFDLYRNGDGVRGRLVGAPSGDVVTLTVASDTRNFKVGMTVVADDTITGASLRDSGDSTTVTSIDEDAGTLTLASVAAISGLTTNDYLFAKGDVNAACMEGLASLTPLTAPSASESFRGIDRSVHASLLAGTRIDDTGTYLEENLGLLGVKIATNGSKATDAYCNPLKFHEMVRRRDAKIMYDDGGGKAEVGFEYITISTAAGAIKVYADPDCPSNRAYVCNSDAHYLKHLEGLPHIIKDDGNPSLRSTTADEIEARVRAWVNYIQTKPACFGVCSV